MWGTMAPLSRRTEAQRSKRSEVEARLVEATEGLLAEGATYAELGIERIAKRAGISRTAFYFHFRDKRELLTRLTSDVAAELYEEAARWWSGEDGGDGAAELADALRRVVAIYRRHASLLRTVVEAAAYDPEVALYWRALVARFVDATRARIEREQATDDVDRGLPAQMIAFGLCWMTERAAYEHLVQSGDLEDETLADALLAIWLGAVYGRPR
jgi:TetR/AcrR family transcriptional regulator, ethionamide resistance regulator